MARYSFGDVFEISVKSGFYYAIYTHKVLPYGELIRVFDKCFESELKDHSLLADISVRFSTFFAVATGKRVANISVPKNLRKFPLMRINGLPDPKTGVVVDCWLFDGKAQKKLKTFDDEVAKLSVVKAMQDCVLRKELEKSYLPEEDERNPGVMSA